MDKNEITSVSDCKVNGSTAKTGNNKTPKKNDHPFLNDLIIFLRYGGLWLPAAVPIFDIVHWLGFKWIFRSLTVDESPLGVYNTNVFSICICIGAVWFLADFLCLIFGFSLRHRSVKNMVLGVSLLSSVGTFLVSFGQFYFGNPLSWFNFPYDRHYRSADPFEYIFKLKMYDVYGLGWLSFIVFCLFAIIGVCVVSNNLRKNCKYCKDKNTYNSSLFFYAYGQVIVIAMASAAIAFILSVIVYIRFEKIGSYYPILIIPVIVVALCAVLIYQFGANVIRIQTVRDHFDDPKFKELMARFRDSENPDWWHKVRLDDDMIDELVVYLIDNDVLVKNKEDNDGNSELNKWYCVSTAAIDEYAQLESRVPFTNEPKQDKKRFRQRVKDFIRAVPGFFRRFVCVPLAFLLIAGTGLGVFEFVTNSNREKADYRTWIKQYAENPAVQELVANSENGLVFVTAHCADFTLLNLIDMGLLIPSQDNLSKDQIAIGRWYTFDDNLIEACQQAQNNTAEDTSPP